MPSSTGALSSAREPIRKPTVRVGRQRSTGTGPEQRGTDHREDGDDDSGHEVVPHRGTGVGLLVSG
jgi:hypothetical protein